MARTERGLRQATRWGLLGVALLSAAGIIVSTALGYLEARALAPPLARGQAEAFIRTLRERARPELGAPGPQILQGLLDRHAADGLRYVALLDRGGRVLAAAGKPAAGGHAPAPAPGEMLSGSGWVRVLAPPPPLPGPPPWGPHGPGPPFPPLPEAASLAAPGAPGPAAGASILLEFAPLPAERLLGRAEVSLAVGGLGAIVLMIAAGVLWRLSVRADRAEADLGRQRHLAALGEMSAVMAHEIRNPLAAAKGHAQLLAEQIPESERQRRWVDVVVEQIERIEALSGQLLDFARGGRLQREAVAPAELLREAADALAAGRFAFDVERAPASWSVDRSRLRQVLTNLLQNAVQASPPDKPIDATAAQERGMLVFTVRDRGPGLPPGEGERIFEPFHTTRLRGTGLGLAVARRLAELHGGTIEARDHPEGGAEFRVLIPPPAES